MPEWFKSGGNIREQHSQIAAGVAKEYEKKADGHFISVLVVDPVSVKKVDTGVLKGFSIGIKSPRVVRDTKAVNGRIIDGQIVEVSLVDRPANPNCQLVLAKSVAGESGVWKVEELIEKSDEVTPEATEVVAEVIEETAAVETPIAEIVEEAKLEELGIEKSAKAKTILATLIKFDKGQYEAARNALASLIAVEAEEMKDPEGHSEVMSISHLLEAVAHLYAWYEGEEAAGEVAGEETEAIEMAVKPETAMEDETKSHHLGDNEKCAKCGKMGKACKCDKSATPVPTAETGANLDTATIVPPSESPKSAEPEEKVSEVTEEVTAESLEAIVEKAVKSATESIRSEVAALVSAKEAALEKATTLESELATAKSLAIGGGPKRTVKPIDTNTTNDLLTKALAYETKANATTDPTLAKGYGLLAKQYRTELNNLSAN
jgi:hypothetical protein